MDDAGDAQPAPGVAPTLRALLRARGFAALFVAHAASNLGDWLAFLALWARVGLHGGAGAPAVAALAVAYLAPLVVVMPVAAACVDRWPLRRVLVASDVLRAAVVAAFVWTDSLAGQCALLFALQALGCFFNPAQAAAVARLVPRSSLVAANALTAQAAHAAKIIGPAVAGLVVGAWGARSAFLVDAVSFLWSATWLATLPQLAPVARSAPHVGVRPSSPFARRLADAGAGLRFIGGDATVRATVAGALAAAAGLGAWLACFAVIARDRWALAARGTGLVVSSFGAGAIAGAALAVPLSQRSGAPRLVPVGLLALALALAAVAAVRTPLLGVAATFALGAATALVLVPAASWLQAATPPALQGRVQGAAIAAFGLVQAASLGAAGLASSVVGETRWVAIAAAAVAAAAAVLVYTRPAARARSAGARDTCGSPST